MFVALYALAIFGNPSASALDSDLIVVRNILRSDFVRELPDSVLQRPSIDSIVAGCDHYTFMADDDDDAYYKDMYSALTRNLGLEFREDSLGLFVSRVRFRSPSYFSGVSIGDRLIAIDDGATVNKRPIQILSTIVARDTGIMKLALQRGSITVSVSVRVELFENSCVTQFVDGYIGYLRVDRFTSRTAYTIRRILAEFRESGVRRIVIDLRGNSGGLLFSALDLLEQFANEGDTLLSLKFRRDSVQLFTATRDGAFIGKPLEVLVSNNTASASEVFAVGVHFNDYGYVLGDKTFGKGKMQQSRPLPSGRYFQFTHALINGPKGVCIDNDYGSGGMVPDLKFDVGTFHWDSVAAVAAYLPDMAQLRRQHQTVDTAMVETVKSRMPLELQTLSSYYIIRSIWNELGQLYWVSQQPRYTRWKQAKVVARRW